MITVSALICLEIVLSINPLPWRADEKRLVALDAIFFSKSDLRGEDFDQSRERLKSRKRIKSEFEKNIGLSFTRKFFLSQRSTEAYPQPPESSDAKRFQAGLEAVPEEGDTEEESSPWKVLIAKRARSKDF